MKKLLLFGLLSLSIVAGCKMQKIYDIGTSETDFKANKKDFTIIEQTEHSTIYRKYDHVLWGLLNPKYYYFTDGKLVRVDLVGPNPNVIIQQSSN